MRLARFDKSVQLASSVDDVWPLVVDTDGDGECDDINPDVVPASIPIFANEAAVIKMVEIEPNGAAFFGPTSFGGTNAATCSEGTDTQPPASLCDGEPDATVAIKAGDQGQIFGLAPVDATRRGYRRRL